MDLDEFVEKGLVQLVQGVEKAQNRLLATGSTAELSPPIQTEWGDLVKSGLSVSRRGLPVQEVEFDVAVTATEMAEAKGGLKVVISSLSGGLSSTDSVSSRMKFRVPVTLPLMPSSAHGKCTEE